MAYNFSLPTGHASLEARVVWGYTQDTNNNTSTITAHVEARRTSSYMTTTDLANPNMEITIDGETFNFNGNYSFSAHPVWEWFWIGGTATKKVWHSADGTKSLNISTWHNTSVANFGNIWKTQSVTLNTIPRASTISSGTDWVVGHEADIYINRKSTDFYHSVFLDIGLSGVWQNFSVRYGVGGYLNTNFTQTEQQAMMDYFIVKGNIWSAQSRIRIETYNSGGSQIGSTTEIVGTIWRPAESAIASQSSLELALAGVPYTLSGVNGSKWITHSLKLYSGTFSKTITLANGASATGNITLVQANLDAIYALYTTQAYAPFNIEVTTLLAGKQLGAKKTVTTGDGTLAFNTTAIAPTFAGVPTYADTNTAITAITTNNQHIVQNKSNLKVTIPASSSTAKYGATLATYAVSVNGIEKTVAYSALAVVVDFGLVNVASNTTAQVAVVDSRGSRTSKSIQITVFPYSTPTITGSAARANGFDNNTTLSALGALASVNAKNTLSSVQYRYKLTSIGTWGSYIALTPTVTTGTYTTNSPVVVLDNGLTYNLEFKVTDGFGGTATAAVFLDTGKPIMFVDKAHKSVGIGKFPTNNNSLEVEGNLFITGTGGNAYHTGKKPTPAEIGAAATSHTHTPASLGAEPAIVSGSNANGGYIKFADGTMVCYGTTSHTAQITTPYNSMYYDSTKRAITFPVSFYSQASVSAGGYDCFVISTGAGTTGANYWIYRVSSNTDFPIKIQWTAWGRWKA